MSREYPPTTDITYASCFISPAGVFYPVPAYEHFYFAIQYSMHDIDPVGDLERRGWVHISIESDGYFHMYTGLREVTQVQQDVLFSMLMDAPANDRLGMLKTVRTYISDFGIID
jgi:hypothetical protein